MSYKRADRVAEQIRRELARILLREVKDPDVKKINISDVKITDDLHLARIYFTVMNESSEREKAKIAIQRAVKFIRGEIGKCLDLRLVPELEFIYDTIPEYTRRMDALFDQIRKETPGIASED